MIEFKTDERLLTSEEQQERVHELTTTFDKAASGYDISVVMSSLLTLVDFMLKQAHESGAVDMNDALLDLQAFTDVVKSRYKDPLPRSKAVKH